MLDWLQTILGEQYTEELDRKVSAEIGRAFVARADFNELNAENKELRKDERERGEEEASSALLQKQLEEREAAHGEELRRLRLDTAVETALSAAGARNKKAVMALLDSEKLSISEDGSAAGLKEQLEALKKEQSFLFETGASLRGIRPAEAGDTAAKRPQEMSYEELCRYLKENPETKLT